MKIKNNIKKSIIALSLLTLATGIAPDDTQATEHDKTKIVCKDKKKYKIKNCNSLNSYLFKAVSKNKLQDLTYYDSYEISKKPLKVGSYYQVVYNHDDPVKAFIITPTNKEKTMLKYSYQDILKQQKQDKQYQRNKKKYDNDKRITIFY